MTTAISVANEVRMIPLEQLEASRSNPRRTMDEAGLQELAASIREHGIQTPLIVRRIELGVMDGELVTDSGDRYSPYEIVCGHRRSEAATIAGLWEAPCLVRVLDDAAAAEIAIVDNLQRVDVPAMEEAEAFGALLERLGSIPAVAAKVGKEQSYVARRLKLLALTPWSRDALREKLITIDHALLLARLGADEQNAALKWTIDHSAGVKVPVNKVIADRLERRKEDAEPEHGEDDEDLPGEVRRARWRREWEPQTVQRLKEHIECESGTPLDRAPWPMEEDWLVPDAGSCLDCPQNTKANTPLFGDLAIGVAVCTDGGCFKAKTQAFVLHGISVAQKAAADKAKIPGKGPGDFEILRVSWESISTVPRQLKDGGGVNPNQIFKDGQWEEAKKKCESTRMAVTVDWSDANNRGYMGRDGKLRKPGEIVQACIEPKCKAHPKAYEKAAARKDIAIDPEKERQARERLDRLIAAEKQVRRALYDAVLAKMKPDAIKRNLLILMQADSNICAATGFQGDGRKEKREHVTTVITKAADAELDALLFHAAFGRQLIVDEYELRTKDKGRGPLYELTKAAGIDAAAIERKFDMPKPAAKAAKKAPAKKAAKAPVKKAVKKAAKKGGRK